MFLPVDDRLALNHLLVVGPEFFGDLLRKEIEIALADGLGFRLAAQRFFKSAGLAMVFRPAVSLA